MTVERSRDPGPGRPRGRWLSILGFVAGLALLVGAITVVGLRWEDLSQQWQATETGIRWSGTRWGLMLLAAGLPIANWVLTSASFWVITRRYGQVSIGEMSALIGAASLLNYLPLRPGLFGRVAYHRAVNGIAVVDSVKVVVLVIGCSGVAAAVLLMATALAGPTAGGAVAGASVIAPGAVLAGLWGIAWAKEQVWSAHAGAVFFRYLDMMVWTGRYAVAFSLWGCPIGLAPAAVLAAVSQAVTLVPLAGNGLGLREWGTGYTTAWLATAGIVAAGGAGARDIGLAADLVNRAGELVALVPIGVLACLWVARRIARLESGAGRPTAEGDNHTPTEQGGAIN